MQATNVHDAIKKHMLGDGASIVMDLKNSKGSVMVDALTGKEYLDFFTFFASLPVGHNHPRMRDAAFLEKLTEASICKPSSSDFYTTYMAEFVETFGEVAKPADMPHLFLVSGGALAVENGLKTAFDWKVRKNFEKIADSKDFASKYQLEGFGTKIIHFKEAFHGRSGYTMSLTNTDDPRKYIYFPKFNWPRILNPKVRFPITEEVLVEVKLNEKIAIEQIETALRQFPGDIAALIIEPIQSEGGDNHFRPEFLQKLQALAHEHEFLFIVDEVQTGMGMTGKMWASEHYGIQPDIIAFGKKSQVCGIIAGERVNEVPNHVFEEESRINSTFGGNLTDMVRATQYLRIMRDENLLDNADKMGSRLMTGLNQIAAESRGLIGNVRGKGLLIAMDLKTKALRETMLNTMQANGLWALKCGSNSIRFRGMLDTPAEIIDQALEITARSIPEG